MLPCLWWRKRSQYWQQAKPSKTSTFSQESEKVLRWVVCRHQELLSKYRTENWSPLQQKASNLEGFFTTITTKFSFMPQKLESKTIHHFGLVVFAWKVFHGVQNASVLTINVENVALKNIFFAKFSFTMESSATKKEAFWILFMEILTVSFYSKHKKETWMNWKTKRCQNMTWNSISFTLGICSTSTKIGRNSALFYDTIKI